MAEWPPSLKPIGKFMARAREVEASEPIVSYYCNFYSLKRALELRDTSDESANLFVRGLLEKCEAQKATIEADDGSHRARVEEFALSIFDQADTEDRAGEATKSTALRFYAAACFLEVCSVFGDLSNDIQERLRYAKWKAADITKAIRAGRKPVPGAPGEAEARAKEEAEEAERAKAEEEARLQAEAAHEAATGDTVASQPADQNSSASSIPPAPPVREYEYETEVHDDSAAGNRIGDSRSKIEMQYPAAPKYPSSDAPSPLQPSGSGPMYPSLDINAPPRQAAPPIPSLEINAPPTSKAPAPPSLDINAPARPPVPSLDIHAPPRTTAPSPPSLFIPGQSNGEFFNGAAASSHAKPATQPPASEPPAVTARAAPVAQAPPPAMDSVPVAAPAPISPPAVQAPPVHAPPVQAPAPVVKKADPSYKPSIKQTQEAQRLAKYAASALDFQDLKTAVSNLEQALGLLTGRQ